MLHKILQAKSGEYFPMNVSVQGEYEAIFNNYQNLRMYKGKDKVTSMPRNVHQLLNVNLIIHVKAEDEVIETIYNNITNGIETFTLGRNEDLVRIDEVKIIDKIKKIENAFIEKNAYIPEYMADDISGINYRLNTKYEIKNELRNWEKVNVKYVEKNTSQCLYDIIQDEDGDNIYFFEE